MGDRHRTGDPRPAVHRVQDVLRLLHGVRGAAQHQRLPRLHRAAGCAAGRQRPCRRGRHAARPRTQRPDHAHVPVPPQELLLPRSGQELPDQPVRRAAGPGRPPRRRARPRPRPPASVPAVPPRCRRTARRVRRCAGRTAGPASASPDGCTRTAHPAESWTGSPGWTCPSRRRPAPSRSRGGGDWFAVFGLDRKQISRP